MLFIVAIFQATAATVIETSWKYIEIDMESFCSLKHKLQEHELSGLYPEQFKYSYSKWHDYDWVYRFNDELISYGLCNPQLETFS